MASKSVSVDIIITINRFINLNMCVVLHNDTTLLHMFHKCEMETVFGLRYLNTIAVVYIDVFKVLPPILHYFEHYKCARGLEELILDPSLVPHKLTYEIVSRIKPKL